MQVVHHLLESGVDRLAVDLRILGLVLHGRRGRSRQSRLVAKVESKGEDNSVAVRVAVQLIEDRAAESRVEIPAVGGPLVPANEIGVDHAVAQHVRGELAFVDVLQVRVALLDEARRVESRSGGVVIAGENGDTFLLRALRQLVEHQFAVSLEQIVAGVFFPDRLGIFWQGKHRQAGFRVGVRVRVTGIELVIILGQAIGIAGGQEINVLKDYGSGIRKQKLGAVLE
mmetsp:Transcript_21488/g.46882  ORF Transcript_21488/g.46882 Transcript_21488/m.46882 type:complete len:227 (-) Transcript_21488:930-1610(-)